MHHISKHQGNQMTIKETAGMQLVVIPKRTLDKIEEAVIMNEELIDETEVQDVLHISKKTLSNYCASGKIPAADYTTAVTGRRFFWLKKLLGIKSPCRQLQLPIHG